MSQLAKTISATTLLTLAACTYGSDDAGEAHVDSVSQRVVAGRVSGADENLTVFVTTKIDSDELRCTGTLVAPNLVLTARHCVLLQRTTNMECTSDGELRDATDPRNTDLRTADPGAIAVRYGSSPSEYVSTKSVRVLTPSVEGSICRNDVALVVLERPLVEHFAAMQTNPIARRTPFRFSGWGYTGDDEARLPANRFSRDDLVVSEIGPGLIPASSFAVPGDSLCKGDSGGGAWMGHAIGGVYSRLEGACEDPSGRNVFSMLAPHRAFLDSAFAAVGATPWYEGTPAPWLLKDGAACTTDDQCAVGTCAAGLCGAAVAPPSSAESSPSDADAGGCSATTRRVDGSGIAPILAALGLVYGVRSRRRIPRAQSGLARTARRVLRSTWRA